MSANITPIQKTRLSALKEFAQKVAADYGITEPAEVRALIERIQSRYNTRQPLLTIQQSPKASSMIYRNHIRLAYIDLVAYFIQLKYIEQHLLSAESYSRESLTNLKQQLTSLKKGMTAVATDTHHIELFENSTERQTDRALITAGSLKLLPYDTLRSSAVSDSSITIYPSQSTEVVHEITGKPDQVLASGIGSDVYIASLYCNQMPKVYWQHGSEVPLLIRGMVGVLNLNLSSPQSINSVSMDFLMPTRMIRLYLESADTGKWEVAKDINGHILSTEAGYTLDLNNVVIPGTAKRIQMVLASEIPVTRGQYHVELPDNIDFIRKAKEATSSARAVTGDTGKQFSHKYTLGIYNLKLKEVSYFQAGTYRSPHYQTDRGAITGIHFTGVDVSGNPGVTEERYTAEFYSDGRKLSEMSVLPSTATSVYETLKADSNDEIRPSFYPASDLRIYEKVGSAVSLIPRTGFSFDPVTNVITILNWGMAGNTEKQIALEYTAAPVNAIGYEYGGNIYPAPPSNLKYIVRRLNPGHYNTQSYKKVGASDAIPSVTATVEEHFLGGDLEGNALKLNSIPFVDYRQFNWDTETTSTAWPSNYKPVAVYVRLTANSPEIEATDNTVWTNQHQQSFLNAYAVNNEVEYFLHQNRIFLNITEFYELRVVYHSQADSVRLRINLSSSDSRYSSIVSKHEVDLNVQ